VLLAEAALGYVAGKLLDYIVNEGLAAGDKAGRERVRGWLGRDPRKVALEVALARTDARFADRYPQWHASFFDDVFLGGPAAPLLACALTRTEPVRPAELAQAWAQHLGGQTGQRTTVDIEPAAADFLRWWREELGRHDVFRAALDSRALESISVAAAEQAQATDGVADAVQALREELLAALAERDDTVLRSRYPDLRDFLDWPSHQLQPAAAMFVGREWVFEVLDDFAATHASGYVRIVADAGLGKTALAAAIAARYAAPAFFFSQAAGRIRDDQCLNHLAVELILHHNLAHDHLPDHAGHSASHLFRLLQESTKRRQPVWLVIDALDEAEAATASSGLPLPDQLPTGAFVVVTHRPGGYPPVVAAGATTAIETVPITATGPNESTGHQAADITRYLRERATRDHAVIAAIRRAQPPVTADEFVELLADASEANFMYLGYALEDLVKEPTPSLDAAALPRGLTAYYQTMWDHMRPAADAPDSTWELWDRLRLPCAGTPGNRGRTRHASMAHRPYRRTPQRHPPTRPRRLAALRAAYR
jgi:hypothetical protein